MLPWKRCAGTRGNWCSTHARIHSLSIPSPLSLRDHVPGAAASGHVCPLASSAQRAAAAIQDDGADPFSFERVTRLSDPMIVAAHHFSSVPHARFTTATARSGTMESRGSVPLSVSGRYLRDRTLKYRVSLHLR